MTKQECERQNQYETCINPHEYYYRGCTEKCKYFKSTKAMTPQDRLIEKLKEQSTLLCSMINWDAQLSGNIDKCESLESEITALEQEIKDSEPKNEKQECDHPYAYVHTRNFGETNKCLKCGKIL